MFSKQVSHSKLLELQKYGKAWKKQALRDRVQLELYQVC